MMKKNKQEKMKGIGFPAAIVVMAVISIVAASSVIIIGMEIVDTAKDDEFMDPFFHMKAKPMHQNASMYETVEYTIWFDTDIYLYTPIQLHVEDMYDGVLSDIFPATIYPGENATLQLTAISEGDFFREVVGTYKNMKDKVKVTLSVESDEEPEGDFSLVAEPKEQTAFPNEVVYYKISMEASEDFDGKVQLKVLDCYDGVISCIYPSSIYPGEIAILALYGMCPGDLTRKIIGTCGDMESEVEVELHVMMKTYVPE